MPKVEIGEKIFECPVRTKIVELISQIPELQNRVLAVRSNGQMLDLSSEIIQDLQLVPVLFDSPEGKSIFWHSSSHLMAQAVKRLFPDAKLGIGPAIDEGFYYDFDVNQPFSDQDLQSIESKMKELVSADIPVVHKFLNKEETVSLFKKIDEDYKLEILTEIPDEKVSLYQQDDFVDLCLGPHIPRTGMIRAFKLLSVAGAYWKGDEHNKMLQRIYGISFPTQQELDDYLTKVEEAKRRDHRKLGPALELISIQEEAGAGLVFWHPRGATLRQVIEDYWREIHIKNGYQLVITPHIFRGKLWHTSGHYDYYLENMFTLPVEKEEYVLKPMNCPGHILIYKSKVHSYRDLPVRYAELGTVYRNERSGVLHGAFRVRGITQDDAHIFCTPEQMEDEIFSIIKLTVEILQTFGFNEFAVDLSVRDLGHKEKYMGDDASWEKAEASLISALNRAEMKYHRALGEATFYGPKIDIKLFDSLGREWQSPTIQFDFNLAHRFSIYYMGADGGRHPAFLVHRTILGALERFVGILIEHYAGAFPVWLSPNQAIILTVTDQEIVYAENILNLLTERGIRVTSNFANEKINYKISEAERNKIPYMVIIGKREQTNKNVALRKRGKGDLGNMTIENVINQIEEDVISRR
ncbi:MAG: threonine--tRNA ligase [candidate division WOR-3 bacterium]|nr:threonine--tRNA ligase [candidate division WOR-3 bacterium]